MKVIDLTPEHEQLYFVCLEEWSDEMKEAGNQKQLWFNDMKEKGLRVKLVLNDEGVIAGMIQYLPVEYSIIEGKDLYFICCIWVHGHKAGRGDLSGKGLGTALLEATEADVQSLGAKGIVAWGLEMPFWMTAAWYIKHGYEKIDSDGMAALVWKTYADDAVPPKWIKPKKTPTPGENKLKISVFVNGWCLDQNITYERIKRLAAKYPNTVLFEEYNTRDKAVMEEWGLSDAFYFDSEPVEFGPPPTYKLLKEILRKKLTERKLL